MPGNSSSPGASNSDIDLSLNEEDRVRLLGEKRGKAVVGILESDRAKREAAKGKQKILGVQLWECETAFMHTDQTIPSFPVHLCGQRPLAFLKSSLDGGDLARAALLLDSGVFANLSLPNEIILYFCDLALSPCDMGLTTPAFRALSQIWKRPTVPAPDAMEWVPPPGAHPEALEPIQRNDALCRLIRLLMISTQSAQQTPSEIPDFIMAVLLVGMDPSSSPDLQRDIILTVDLLCQSIAPGTDISTDIETAICNKVIKFASGLQPINKAQLVALLAGGSGRTARIARWVAHAIITKSMTVSAAKYNDLPPLILLLEQALSPEIVVHKPETRIRGLFEVYEDTDYIDMGFYVQVLAVAISNVEGYVLQEARELTALPPGSPGKPAAEKPETMLTLVRIAIENLHSRIVDTRATHLDRSRAKGALKQLSMRMHYQQEAALRSRSGKKSRPIQQYFAKPK
ncbi:hypothetical protein B0H11DRAFT_2337325 [Mycena galericulata]|nr:hypothetical protein B0H11DRAFT_2337325 [Mycena galericulata]